ncbi:MAG: DUF3455 domain-containing protein [Methylovulum sp.]|uniref:DUF3455 domain-containing protein n=1 Tax=Methylovulum sp. TaxID=1916980 RepID=UPI002615F022|nr:DUF3455 domain-containing protein [Methylovulum sp.]MDD2723406.1 DUF3455 domain-containing protein [Methylovulum sp.]MDD5125060.1 DUF3455 domain-containing protein [Methylovulum sp.]
MLKKILILSILLQTAAYANCKIPEPIKAPEGQQAFLSVHAQGEQIYQCTLNQNKYAWEAKAPDALLFDDHGQVVGKHYAGPIWEYKAGSHVVGRVVKKLDVSDKAIAWLLVEVVSHKGKDFFADAKFINRINTQGGLPPTSGCDGNHLGNEKRVAYKADYVFFKGR